MTQPLQSQRDRDNAAIDANHAIFLNQKTEIELLRILLRLWQGDFTTIQDKYKVMDIAKKCPLMKEAYKLDEVLEPGKWRTGTRRKVDFSTI